jgi:MFS family permease
MGSAWFGIQVFWAFHGGSMPLFLRDFTDSKFTISLVLSLAGVMGLVVTPVVGYLSDRTTSRFGRRLPYVFLGVLGLVTCVLLLSRARAFGLIAFVSGAMYFFARTAEAPYLSLIPDLTAPEQRGTASGVMNLCGSFGAIACFIAASLIWERSPTTVFVMVALVCLGAMLVTVGFIREPASPPRDGSESVIPSSILRSVMTETNAIKWLFAQFFWWIGFFIIVTFAILFVAEELGVPEGKAFLVIVTFPIVATVLMLPMGMLGDRVNRKRALMLLIGLSAASQILISFSQTLTHAIITVGLSAIPFAGIMAIGYAFFLDLIPRERTAAFLGVGVMFVATAQMIGPLIGGKLIDTLGYRSIFPAATALMALSCFLVQFVRPDERSGAGAEEPPVPLERD